MTNALNIGNVLLPSEGFPSIYAFQLPVLDGLEGAFFFGDGLALINKNFAPGKKDASVKGAPELGANGGVKLGINNYIDTGIVDSDNMTVVSVFRDIAETGTTVKSGIIGNNLSLVTGGIGLYRNESGVSISGTAVKTPTGGGANALETANVAIVSGAYTIAALRARSGATSTTTNFTSGSSGNGALSGPRVLGPNNIWIGRLPNGGFTSTHEQMLAMIFSRSLTDAELNRVAAHARAYCVSKGQVA
ncbi:hypothetical protein IR009_08810 [Pseudomonas putida]|uniref:hypothetical protein n=1 Tax=Pseudomonas putida TaxID=303 RepID=UPI0018AB2F54|nr:hypothetical protein [Pseudomonas putida]MBF8765324.1 hypothetical protein [Pseudomonas putida]